MRWSAPWRPRSPPDGVGHCGRAAGDGMCVVLPRGPGAPPSANDQPHNLGVHPGGATADPRAGPEYSTDDAATSPRARRATTLPKSYDCCLARHRPVDFSHSAAAQRSHARDLTCHGGTRERGRPVTLTQSNDVHPPTAVADRMRVLLVDANRPFAELLGNALDAAGMTWIGSAHSAQTGVAM